MVVPRSKRILSQMNSLLYCLAFFSLTASLFADDWVTYRSPDGAFTAEFPAAPTKETKTIETDIGKIPYTTVMAELYDGQVAFGVAYNVYPEEIRQANPQSVLDGARDGATESLKGKLVGETRLTIDGYPGREFTIVKEKGDEKMFFHARIFLIDRRLYQLQVVRVGEHPVDIADVVRFMAQFKPEKRN